jgi:chromosome segregation ATPase
MTIQQETMSPKGDMERLANFSSNCCDQTQISQSEVSPVQNTASEESESQEAQNQERVNLTASRDGPNLLSKRNKEKRSYTERENSSFVAQISDLQKQIARLNAGKNKSERDLVFLQGRYDGLEREYSQLKLQKAGWAREKKALSGSKSKIENEKTKLESSNEALEDDKEKLKSALRESDIENVNMRKRIKKIDNEKEKLKDGKAALEEQIIALNLHQTQLGSVITSLKEDNRTLSAQLNAFQDEEKIMIADKNFLQNKLVEFNSAKNKWVDTNNELSRMVGDLQRENAQLEEDNMRLIDQCSGLVQEISGLRLQHSIDDDSALQEKFHSLHFAIRSWCCQIHDAKPLEKSAVFRQFPLGAPGSVCQLSHLADHEVNVLIACTWEWMVKLIFGSSNAETGYHDSPDLWLEEDMAWCLHNLELQLQTQGKEGHSSG